MEPTSASAAPSVDGPSRQQLTRVGLLLTVVVGVLAAIALGFVAAGVWDDDQGPTLQEPVADVVPREGSATRNLEQAIADDVLPLLDAGGSAPVEGAPDAEAGNPFSRD